MVAISQSEVQSYIKYLVRKNHPIAHAVDCATMNGKPIPYEQREEIRKKADDYQSYLQAMSYLEVKTLYEDEIKEERKKQELIAQRKAEQEERQRFFNQPGANADFEHWSKAAYWTPEEAVALSFGKDPDKVTMESIKRHATSPFVKQYNKLMDLVRRALHFDVLYNRTPPLEYLQWAKDNDILFPNELEKLVIKRAGEGKNWEQEYSKLEKEVKEHRNTVRIQQSYIEQLETQLAEAKNNQVMDGYMSPYMKLMQQAVKANSVTETNHQKKQTLVQWIKDNAPEGLEISNNMAESMATLIRSPEAKKGGNIKVS